MLLVFESTRPASSTNRQKCSDIRFTILRPLDVPYISKVCVSVMVIFFLTGCTVLGLTFHLRMYLSMVTFLIKGCGGFLSHFSL